MSYREAIDMIEDMVVAQVKSCYPERDLENFRGFDLLYSFGSAVDALIYSSLFWPKFIRIEGMFFLEHIVETDCDIDKVRRHRRNSGSDIKTEMAFNNIEVSALFCGDDSNRASVSLLAKVISECWRAKLNDLSESPYEVHMQAQEDDVFLVFHKIANTVPANVAT
jgi:hypothetical protein